MSLSSTWERLRDILEGNTGGKQWKSRFRKLLYEAHIVYIKEYILHIRYRIRVSWALSFLLFFCQMHMDKRGSHVYFHASSATKCVCMKWNYTFRCQCLPSHVWNIRHVVITIMYCTDSNSGPLFAAGTTKKKWNKLGPVKHHNYTLNSEKRQEKSAVYCALELGVANIVPLPYKIKAHFSGQYVKTISICIFILGFRMLSDKVSCLDFTT